MNKIYLLQFLPNTNPATYTIGAYSSIENILQIDTEKEFDLKDGTYQIVGFILDSTKARPFKIKKVNENGEALNWEDYE